MNDLDQDLRELFETKAGEESFPIEPPAALVRRARMRQLRTVAVAVGAIVALVAGSIAGIAALDRMVTKPRPADEHVDTRTTTLTHATISYPETWHLLDLGTADSGGPILQLSNFDPGLKANECVTEGTGALPPEGVVLRVGGATVEWTGAPSAWPVELESGTASACARTMQAQWREGSQDFVAEAAIGVNATRGDLDRLAAAFASLDASVDPLTAELEGSPALVLDTVESPVGPALLYAYEDDCCGGGSVWLGVAGSAESRLRGSVQIADHVPNMDENLGNSLYRWGAMVLGSVAADVADAEVRTLEGRVDQATLVSLPRSLGLTGQQALLGFADRPTQDDVFSVLYDQQGNAITPSYPVAPRVTIAKGTDPTGGRWHLFINYCNTGTGVGFMGDNVGGSIGCGGLEPLHGVVGDATVGGGNQDLWVEARWVSQDVARVVFRSVGGFVAEGDLYPIQDSSLGIPQFAIVFISLDQPYPQQNGTLVAYGADGKELAEQFIDFPGPVVHKGPTPEIDEAWTILRTARFALGDLAAEPTGPLTFEGLDVGRARAAIPKVAWNDAQAAVPGEVSLRAVQTDRLVIASAATTGETYCVAIELDGWGLSFGYGTQDARSPASCTGGWGPGDGS